MSSKARNFWIRISIGCAIAVSFVIFQNCGPARMGTSGEQTTGSTNFNGSNSSNPTPIPTPTPTATPTPPPPPPPPAKVLQDRWESLGAGAPPARLSATCVSSGDNVYIWGGEIQPNQYKDGYIYNLATKTWTSLPGNSPLAGRHAQTATLVGSKMYIFGGALAAGGNVPSTNNGATYDIITGAWSTIFTMPLSNRWGHTAVWTGSKIIILGGKSGETAAEYKSDGAAFDPATETWSSISTVGAPSLRAHAAAVWTGSRMIVWGGWSPTAKLNDGAAYDPVTDTWSPLQASPLAPRGWPAMIWTGYKMVVFGGHSATDGATFDPATGIWAGITSGPLAFGRAGMTSCWTTRGFFLWGGVDETWNTYYNDGAIYY